jgi:1,2-phenylacetyl-CoA epoxidase catalytic subunit
MDMEPLVLDEESRALLRRIVERQAYRQLMAANIRGHGMKLVPDVEEKLLLSQDLEHSLKILREVERLYKKLDGADLATAVRGRMDRIPYPTTRLELAVCLALCDRAEQVAADGYSSSRCREFSAIARSLAAADRTFTHRSEELFADFCRESTNRPAAQQMFNRWLSITLLSLGRPSTVGDSRAVQLGLRSKRCAESVREFLNELKPLMERCHLHVPSGAVLGVELPSEVAIIAGR